MKQLPPLLFYQKAHSELARRVIDYSFLLLCLHDRHFLAIRGKLSPIGTLLVAALLIACSSSAKAEASVAVSDSLVRRLRVTPADTNRVLLLNQLVRELATSNADQSLRYGREGLRLARELRYGGGEALLLTAVGSTYFFKEDLGKAAHYYQQAVRRAQAIPQAGHALTMALLGLGRIGVMQHDYVESQRYFRQVLLRVKQYRYPEQSKDISAAYNSLGVMYFDWINSGQAYPDSVGRLCLYYNRLALTTLRHGGSIASLAIGLNGVGNAHRLAKRYDSTEYYHRAALRIFKQLDSPYNIAQTQVWLGAALTAQHRAPEALPLLRSALANASRLRLPALRADCYLELAAALAEIGQGMPAYRFAKVGQTLLDSLKLVDQRADLTRLRVQFATELAQNRVRELTYRTKLQALETRKQRHYVWWLASFLLAVAVGLVVSAVLAWRLRRQQIQLVNTRAEQDRLYALIAHDLRSPVMAFGGLADLLTTYVERQDTVRLLRLGGRVRQAAESLRELLDNLLNWALSQRGELRPVLEPVPVAPLLAELGRLYQPVADITGIRLKVVISEIGCVLADRQMTLTVLRNLLSNAIHATPAGGTITIRAVATGNQHVLLEVTDTGRGMSEEELDSLLDNSALRTAVHYRGRAGLGLRLSWLFAQAQAGELKLQSTPRQGTTATLLLPHPYPLPAAYSK